MYSEKRKVLIEKYKLYDYIDIYGNKIWLNKYGDVIKSQYPNGKFYYGVYPRVSISAEFIQDLTSYHCIDAEAELTRMLSETLAQNINLEILRSIINAETTL